jgi:BAH domain
MCSVEASPPEDDDDSTKGSSIGGGTDKGDSLSSKHRHQLKHRELFLSRQVETLPATHIRGKCSVTLLNETESLLSYLNKDVSWTQCLGGCWHKTYTLSLLFRRILFSTA